MANFGISITIIGKVLNHNDSLNQQNFIHILIYMLYDMQYKNLLTKLISAPIYETK
ncbi:putative integrase, partial [Orientia tsutsugamushi str. Gilliam]